LGILSHGGEIDVRDRGSPSPHYVIHLKGIQFDDEHIRRLRRTTANGSVTLRLKGTAVTC
jgi:hypothetical protein